MEQLQKQATALGQEICKSPCGRTYLFYLKKMEQKPILLEKIEKWKAFQLEVSQQQKTGTALSFDQKKRLSEGYEEVMMDPDGVGFLRSQISFLQMTAELLEQVAKELPKI